MALTESLESTNYLLMMKAILVKGFGPPEVLQIADVPAPVPGPDQVLLRVRAAGVNPVDTYIRSGKYARLPQLPYTPGTDGAGVVEKTGENASGLAIGNRVWFSGTSTGAYAEYAVCSASQVHPLPDRISFSQGAAIGTPYMTAYRALFQRGRAVAGETVLIHGATGGVGTAAVQLAGSHGLVVMGTGGSESGREEILANGAHYAFDHHSADYSKEVMTATGGKGVDVILEMLANVNLATDLTLLAKFGRVIVIGSRGKIELDPRDAMGPDADIRGMLLFNASDEDLSSVHDALEAGLKDGTLNPKVGAEFKLADAPAAHEAVMEAGAHGKIVLIPDE